ncbi:BREX-1 system adenine-specific DNA-methyltransferase PglX [Enterococcus italicus]|uniref:BREX-1 system adenine-specific DNA-methyltransferase PglX n=1 Tax=Enterococcus italicus TaxID=246144 RepID=UPI002073119E|nr:BREX-1 system adenine-specific DNA-methyltransferase PglX [Enterococcus italicus]MCM6931605.1 BREX-1 system adenine-specific DNA-methyltransferase PglX [Enterococcus italicus]
MDKKAIKNFAIESRNVLRSRVINKLTNLGITNKNIEEVKKIGNDTIDIESSRARFIGKDVFKRSKLVDELNRREKQVGSYEVAYETLVEEVAYTWFNRVIAIRFMEVNNYLPGRLRVLSSESPGKREPDIITHLLDTDLYAEMDTETKNRVIELLSDGSAEAVDELYQLVFIKQCNSLNQQLPDLFERIDDYTELLFTISYIDDNGVIANLLTIPESDFDVSKEGQVEIIGWMYQYYNTEPKDKVFARGNRKIRADEIPAATQLFTPDWIVRYMVENSLGRYYIDQKMASPSETRTEKEIADEFGWKYYLPTAEQPEDVQLQLAEERKEKSVFALQELKLLDNAMGSGHVLVYAFDVFIQLYTAEGYGEREAAELIMTQNLFGLEIDKRAYQLAYFAIMMKGRQYSRRILSKNIRLNLHQFVNSTDISDEYFNRLEELSSLSKAEFNTKLNTLKSYLKEFENATEVGSILNFHHIKIEKINEMREFISVFEEYSNMDILYQIPETQKKTRDILSVIEIVASKYTAVVTNPPYLNKMSTVLDKYVKKYYPDVKTDLFSIFIKMNSNMLVNGGYAGFMTPFVWMFIKSYEELRNFLITNKSISSLVQMEYSAFEEATVPVCCFTIKNARTERVGNYFKLSDFRGGMKIQEEKVLEAIEDTTLEYFYQTNQENFMKIPGNPISFWVSENLITIFQSGETIGEKYEATTGLQTSDNNRFIRFWYEPSNKKIYHKAKNNKESISSNYKWFPYNKSGGYRKWYGNNWYVLNWENNGSEIREYNNFLNISRVSNIGIGSVSFFFKENISWSKITSSKFSATWQPEGYIFDVAASSMFGNNLSIPLSFLNSIIAEEILKIYNPTLNFQVGNITKVPIIESKKASIITIDNIYICMKDWDSYETSWDFKKHPLL